MNWQISYHELFMGRCHIQFPRSLYDTWSITFRWTFTFCLPCDFLPRKLNFGHCCYPTGVKLCMSTPQALSLIFMELREALLQHFQNWQYIHVLHFPITLGPWSQASTINHTFMPPFFVLFCFGCIVLPVFTVTQWKNKTKTIES